MVRPRMYCPKCRVHRPMELHHVLPRRFFGRKGNDLTFLLCGKCHDQLEQLIPEHEQLPKDEYVHILLRFLEETKPP